MPNDLKVSEEVFRMSEGIGEGPPKWFLNRLYIALAEWTESCCEIIEENKCAFTSPLYSGIITGTSKILLKIGSCFRTFMA
jgi:hypothetical protein